MDLLAIGLAIPAFLVSAAVLWKQYLKPFRLWGRFQSVMFDGLNYDGNGFVIVLPVVIGNSGARPGFVSSFAVYLRSMEDSAKVFVFHGAGTVDATALIGAWRAGKAEGISILQGGMPAVRLSDNEQKDLTIAFVPPEALSYSKAQCQGFRPTTELITGKYDLELYCFVDAWVPCHKIGIELTPDKVDSLRNSKGFINNSVPAFDVLRPKLWPKARKT